MKNNGSKKIQPFTHIIILLIAFLIVFYTCSRLFLRTVSIHENQEIYDALTSFVPAENSKIEIIYSPPDGASSSQQAIVLTNIEEQKAAANVLSQLTNDGFFLYYDANPIDRFFLGEAFPYFSVSDVPTRYYTIVVFAEDGHCISHIYLCEEFSIDRLSQHYFLKYGNTAPAISYFDTLFGVTASS